MPMTPLPTVLVVDDEADIRNTLIGVAQRLREHVMVVAVGGSAEARGVIQRRDVSGLVTDVRMPGGTGVELIQWVHAHTPGIRCALMTGYQEDTIDGIALNTLDLVGVLRKPFRVNDAREILLALAGGRVPRDAR